MRVSSLFGAVMEILYKSKDLIAVYKPPGIPSQQDLTGDVDIMSMCSETLRASGEKSELWLIHRLDRVVGGVMLFARSREAAAELSALVQDKDSVKKRYLAVVEGEIEDGVMEDFIYKDTVGSKAYIVDRERRGVKRCRLEGETLGTVDTDHGKLSLVSVLLYTGRFHQIRAQLSHRGASIVGDKKYGSRNRLTRKIALFAYRLDIKTKREEIRLKKMPELSEYPWSLFYDKLSQMEENYD